MTVRTLDGSSPIFELHGLGGLFQPEQSNHGEMQHAEDHTPEIVVKGRRGNEVTIMTVFPLYYNIHVPGFARIGGHGTNVSGIIPAGAMQTGIDRNHNNIPDTLDSLLSDRNTRWLKPNNPRGDVGGPTHEQ